MGWLWCPFVSHIPLAAWGQDTLSRAHGVRTWPPSNSDDKLEFVAAINSDHLINLEKQKKVQKVSCWLSVNHNWLNYSVFPPDMKDTEITKKELLSTALCATRSKIQVTGDETTKISDVAKHSIVSAQENP